MNNCGELDKTLKLVSDLFETLFKISDQQFVMMTNNAGKTSTYILHTYNLITVIYIELKQDSTIVIIASTNIFTLSIFCLYMSICIY